MMVLNQKNINHLMDGYVVIDDKFNYIYEKNISLKLLQKNTDAYIFTIFNLTKIRKLLSIILSIDSNSLIIYPTFPVLNSEILIYLLGHLLKSLILIIFHN